MILLLALLLLSYLAGSIPTSIIGGRVTRGIDIRDYGSGNAGATNAFRVLGWKPALVVVLVDIFKGWFAAAVISGFTLGGALGELPTGDQDLVAIFCGAAAVLGIPSPSSPVSGAAREWAPWGACCCTCFP